MVAARDRDQPAAGRRRSRPPAPASAGSGPARRPRRGAAAAGPASARDGGLERRWRRAAPSGPRRRRRTRSGSRAARRVSARRPRPGRSPPPRPRRAGRRGDDRQVAAHARAAQRDRGLLVADRARAARPAIAATSSIARPSIGPPLAPWPRWSKATAASPCADRRAGEVVMALLARAGAVQDHHAGGAGGGAARPAAAATGCRPGPPCRRSRREAAGVTVRVARTISFAVMTAVASELSHVYPARHPGQRARPAGARRLRRGRAGAASSAPPATWSSRTICAAARGSSSTRWRARHADFDVLFASKAFPCTAVYRALARGGAGLRRGLRRRAGAGPGRRLRSRAHVHARQRQVGRRSCARRCRPGSATWSSTRCTSSSGWR